MHKCTVCESAIDAWRETKGPTDPNFPFLKMFQAFAQAHLKQQSDLISMAKLNFEVMSHIKIWRLRGNKNEDFSTEDRLCILSWWLSGSTVYGK